jgi:hypothetical protein
MTNFSLYIPAGTKVLSRNGLVTLEGDCAVSNAIRQADGGFTYTVGKTEYYCAAGCCEFSEQGEEVLIHKNGLVAFA